MRIEWSDEAIGDLERIFEDIVADDPHAARQVSDRIRQNTVKLSEFPRAARMGRVAGTRELVITGLPYIVVYSISDGRIDIITVRHTSRLWPESFGE